MLVGEHGHAEDQGVDAGEHAAGRAQHAGDLGDHRLGGQVHGQRAVVGDDAVRAAVGQERQPRGVGDHRENPALLAGGTTPQDPPALLSSSGGTHPPGPPSGGTHPPRPPLGGAAGPSMRPWSAWGGIQDPQDRMAGPGGQFGGGRARARHVDEQVPPRRQPLGQLGARHCLMELPVNGKLITLRRGDRAGRMLHGPRTPDSALLPPGAAVAGA
jgi:hypothetical protein